jgi:hypothetical protein
MNKAAEVAMARSAFLDNHEMFLPMARIDTPDEMIIAMIDIDGFEKWGIIADLAKAHHATKVVFVADTWMRRIDSTPEARAEWERSNKRVRDYNDKYEALVVTMIDAESIEVVLLPYVRAAGGIMWDPEETPPDARIVSEGANLVQAALR